MKYPKTAKYDTPALREKIMGPHPLKLEEELLIGHRIPEGSVVMDLGSGQGVTSMFLAKEYGFFVFAADLWSDPTDNQRYFESLGLTPREIIPLRADATALPFPRGFFDAVVSTDSYNYFGRDPEYLDQKLAPFVKPGGYIYIAIPGMKRDFNGDYPPELLLSWTPEQLDYLRDIGYWRGIVEQSKLTELVSICEMQSNEEVWADWLACENDYARGDRRSMEAGAGRHLNFIAIVLKVL